MAMGRTGSRELFLPSDGFNPTSPAQARRPERIGRPTSAFAYPLVHSNAAEVERCLQELDKVHFTVSAEIVGTPEEFSERLGSHAYDLVVAEYPSLGWRETQSLELLDQSKRQIPLIFVGHILQRETVAEFITRGAYDCIEIGRCKRKHCAMNATEHKTV